MQQLHPYLMSIFEKAVFMKCCLTHSLRRAAQSGSWNLKIGYSCAILNNNLRPIDSCFFVNFLHFIPQQRAVFCKFYSVAKELKIEHAYTAQETYTAAIVTMQKINNCFFTILCENVMTFSKVNNMQQCPLYKC